LAEAISETFKRDVLPAEPSLRISRLIP
jgi:hypothetical protein